MLSASFLATLRDGGLPAAIGKRFTGAPVVHRTAPVSLTLPWSWLISDNAKYLIRRGRLFKTVEYREARKKIATLALGRMEGAGPMACPLQLVARVYVPDNRIHDVHNFGKCAIDAMTKTVFVDDHWLHDVRWIRAGVDVDSPRAELSIRPIEP